MASEDLADKNIQNAIREFRLRVKNVISSDVYEDTHLFYRFLKARDFDIDKAEAMFRKHLNWRKAFQVDTVLERFKPKGIFLKYLQPSIIGFDKAGDMVSYSAVGKYDPKNILKCFKINQYMKHWTYYGEQTVLFMKNQNEKTGEYNYRGTLIFDLDKLTFSSATDKGGAEVMMKITQLLQDNHPERMKALYIINAPAYYVFIYSILKRILSNATVQKIHVFGQNGWKEVFLKNISADVLPAFLGGNRTDPDGNPLCLSFICHGCILPSKYFLTDEERFFKDRSLVKMLKIQPMQKMKIFVEVSEYGSLIEWEFEVKNKDIGFGLFVQDAYKEVEVLPIQKFFTSDGTEKDSYKANLLGTYIIVFDNTYSRFSAKEVQYTVTVTKF